jgi:AraC-like DNA-binding protein
VTLRRSSLLSLDRRTIAAFWVSGIAHALIAEQLDAPALFTEAGLDYSVLNDPDARFESDRVSHLWELALARSGNPAIGLAGASRAGPGHFGVVAYSLMSAPDLLGTLHRIARYVGIVSDVATVSVRQHADGYRLVLDLSPGRRPVPHQRFAFDLLIFLSFCRWVSGGELTPTGVGLSHPGGGSSLAFEAVFGCRPKFAAAENALIFSHADAIRPLPTANDRLSPVHDRIVTEHLRGSPATRLTARVRTEIARRLPDGAPTRGVLALALAMSERTLHRRLTDEGASFQRLIDETRRELAADYLARADLSLADVSFSLGFKDQGSFFRAVHRWFRMTPRQYRLQATASRLP